MTLHAFSRRRLLGNLLAGLAACLSPRSPPTDAPCRSEPPAPYQLKSAVLYNTYSYDYETCVPNGEFGCVTTYVYDGNSWTS